MLIVILIFCQGGLHDRGVHLPWGPTWWQRGGHFAGAPCTRKNKCAQTLVAGRTPEHAHKNNFGLGEGNIQRTRDKTVVWFLTSANL